MYVFTGEGKGKTSAALGTALRAIGNGMSVAWVAWYKQASWRMSEVTALEKLGIQVFLMGKGFYISGRESRLRQGFGGQAVGGSRDKAIKTAKVGDQGMVVDTASQAEHKQAAEDALVKAQELIGEVDVLILDEVNNAVEEGLIKITAVTDLISKRGKTNVIMTGRSAHSKVIELADLVTEMKKVKHPYDKGDLAVKGLDF